jgi:hypothetical protein
MKSIEAAQKRALAGDRWRLKMECTTGSSNKNYTISGGPGWNVRKNWGPIGGHKDQRSEPGWSFSDALVFFRGKMKKSGYVDIEVTQPTAILPAQPEIVIQDAEAVALVSAVGDLTTTTNNSQASGFLTPQRRAMIQALWAKSNPDKAAAKKVKKALNLPLPEEPGEVSDRFSMLEMDDTDYTTKSTETTEPSDRFSMLEMD